MVAQEYAKAIYELANEENKIELYSEYFQIFENELDNQDFYKVLVSPSIDDEAKKNIIIKAFSSFDEMFINFIKVIIDHKRISDFKDIYDEYVNLANEALGVVDVLIVSADTLTKNQNTQLEEALVSKFNGKRINIKNIIDPKLISGVKVICNGKSLDISLKNSLDKLKDSLC